MSELRINARLDEQTAADLEYLKEVTQSNNTEAMKKAIRFYADRLRNEISRSKQALIDSGFVGGFEGPEDLSTNYKRYFAEYLDEKYPE